jgi:cytochrome c-type biogenesis protein CcsB
MKKALSILFSMAFTAILLSCFAGAIAYATFIENDFGTAAAKAAVYSTRWFEMLLLILSINLVGSLFQYQSFSKKKWSIILFHIAFVIIFIGAAVTRYFGYEGSMHIREGYKTNYITTYDTYLRLELNNGKVAKLIDTKFAPVKNAKKLPSISTEIEGQDFEIKVVQYIKNAAKMLQKQEHGVPTVNLVVADSINQYQRNFLSENQSIDFGGVSYTFDNSSTGTPGEVNFINNKDSLYAEFPKGAFVVDMQGQSHDSLEAGSIVPIIKGALYQIGRASFLVQKFEEKGVVEVVSMEGHQGYYPMDAIQVEFKSGEETAQRYIFGNHEGTQSSESVELNKLIGEVSFGAKQIEIPFFIFLEEFIMERYAGTESPSSFKSNIVLLDASEAKEERHSIFMNNVLNYKGFRFFQSSYDKDEKGTVLSVNYDPIGTKITYFGYFLMALGMFVALFSKKSRFQELLRRSSTKVAIVSLFLLFGGLQLSAQEDQHKHTTIPAVMPVNTIDPAVADEFGNLLVVDLKGRIKPVHTMASELVRKITKKRSFEGYTPTEMFLAMTADPIAWQNAPIIKVSNAQLKEVLNTTSDHVSFNNIIRIERKGGNVIKDFIDEAYAKKVNERTKFDKDVIKVSERIELCWMIFSGSILTVFPVQDHADGKWVTAMESKDETEKWEAQRIGMIHFNFLEGVRKGINENNWDQAQQYEDSIYHYQRTYGTNSLPSSSKINTEVFYNKVAFFSKAGKWYLILGLVLLVMLFARVFNKSLNLKWIIRVVGGGIIVLFALHTFFLGLRWYISGHAPWSNGYETVLFVAWATVLAGLLFAKRLPIAMAVTAVLGAIFTLISGLSFMDPEITNLVPVLKSYWLVIHVAVITASYGFFGMAAKLGILNLIFVSVKSKKNAGNIEPVSTEIGQITEMAIIIGLYLLTLGTFLGAVWANESWGRYWGWDPKETWALITILVYTIVLHIRHIPGIKGVLPISIGSLFGLASVLMTYFGVNYFLSGMHSYAGGDPFVVPSYVSWIVYGVSALILIAIVRNQQNKKS